GQRRGDDPPGLGSRDAVQDSALTPELADWEAGRSSSEGPVRASMHVYNTTTEGDRLLEAPVRPLGLMSGLSTRRPKLRHDSDREPVRGRIWSRARSAAPAGGRAGRVH